MEADGSERLNFPKILAFDSAPDGNHNIGSYWLFKKTFACVKINGR